MFCGYMIQMICSMHFNRIRNHMEKSTPTKAIYDSKKLLPTFHLLVCSVRELILQKLLLFSEQETKLRSKRRGVLVNCSTLYYIAYSYDHQLGQIKNIGFWQREPSQQGLLHSQNPAGLV